MLIFIQENLLLVFSIVGAVVSFLGSFIALVAKKKPIVILAVLLVVGCVVSISYQLFSNNQKQEANRQAVAKSQIEAAAQLARDNIIKEINLTVTDTNITVDAIAAKLLNTNVSQVGTELVSIQSNNQVSFEESTAFAKGSAEMWTNYVNWLRSISSSNTSPSLSLRINAGHHYDGGLLLAYLLTSSVTENEVHAIVNNHSAWHGFEAEKIYLLGNELRAQRVETVLLYSGNSTIPVAFALARDFTQELMVYHRLGQHDKLDELFNDSGADSLNQLLTAFPSLKTTIYSTTQPADLVTAMINQQQSLAISTDGQKTYVVRLEKMVQLAATK